MSQANTWEYLQQTIDVEIKSLEAIIGGLKHRRNALAPISSLPTEVIEVIFSLLRAPGTSSPSTLDEKPDNLAWLRVAHVCHQWREIALNQPLFWSHVDFTAVNSAGAAEILARAKTVPLHLEAKIPSGSWDDGRFNALRKELQDHVSSIRYLDFSAEFVQLYLTIKVLTSPAPTLEYLSLSRQDHPDGGMEMREFLFYTLFGDSTPRLSCLELSYCAISWESPLLRGLKHLRIDHTCIRPSFSEWLDALDEMPQLKTLALLWSSPSAPEDAPIPSRVERTVTLPSLTRFEISNITCDCGLALAHLILPALTSLYVEAASVNQDGSDVPGILPHVARHFNRLQYTKPLQSVFVRSNIKYIEVLAWTLPDIDINIELSDMKIDLPNEFATPDIMDSVQVAFSVDNLKWYPWVHTDVFDAIMAVLPLGSLVTLAVQKHTRLDKQFWLRHVPQWPLLQYVRLAPPAAHGFREMLLEDDGGREGPLLPSLTKLELFDTTLGARRTLHICDTLMERVERGVPLETLDLRTCVATSRAVELLSEIVVEVLGPEEALQDKVEMISMLDSAALGVFVADDDSGVEDYYRYITISDDDEEWDVEGWGEPDDGGTDDDPNE